MFRSSADGIKIEDGYAKFMVDSVWNGQDIVSELNDIWLNYAQRNIEGFDIKSHHDRNEGIRLVDCISPEDFTKHKNVGDFILNDTFISLATQYLGSVPRLGAAQLWWSTRSTEITGSQNWHFDKVDSKQLKIFVNVRDVSSDNGPTTFVNASKSEKLLQLDKMHYFGRVSDDTANQFYDQNDLITSAGPVGACLAVDTCRCVHFGGRVTKGDRLILVIQFLPHNCHIESTAQLLPLEPDRYRDNPIKYLIAKDMRQAYDMSQAMLPVT